MKLFSFLLSIIALIGTIRIFDLSLFDEIAFLLLFVLLVLYKSSNKKTFSIPNKLKVNKYYSKASFSYQILFIYLIASLIYGLHVDLYFGKIRWLIILTALLFYDHFVGYYLSNKLNYSSNSIFLRRFYNSIYLFCLFYLVYGLLAQLLFDIPTGYLQAASEGKGWFAIWGTTAYVAIIFLPLLLFNRALFTAGKITRLRFLSAYFICFSVMLIYDTRVLAVILSLFLLVEFLKMKFSNKIFIIILLTPLATIFLFYADNFVKDLLSSGGFLFTFINESSAEENLRDFDRVAHYIATYQVLSSSTIYALFGSGFLNAGTVIVDAYFNVYYQYGITTFVRTNLAGATQVGTFGLSAFLIENGLVGLMLLFYHIFNLIKAAIKTNLIVSSLFVLIIYPLLFLLFFTIYLNDNMFFYLLLSPATIIYPLIKDKK